MKYIIILGLCISLITIVYAGSYTVPNPSSINLSFPTGYTIPDASSINITFDYSAANDTCTPAGTENHIVKCSDYCNFTALDMGGYNLTFNESGTITFTEWPSNVNIFDNEGTGAGCVIIIG